MASALTLQSSPSDRTAQIRATGEIDLSGVDEGAVFQTFANAERLVLDLSRVEFIHTTGLAALLELRSTLQGRGVLFQIEAAEGPVRQAVDVTGLGHLFAG